MSGTRWTPYRAVLSSRVRAQKAYGASFLFDLFGALLSGLVELAEVWVIFHNINVLGGLDFHEVLLLFGMSNFAFAIADLLVGHLDRLPTYIRAGTLEAFYLRPQPVLLQLMTSDIALRRVARAGIGAGALVAGLVLTDVTWSPATAGMLALALTCGPAIFAGLFVWAASLQFFLVNGSELTNTFTYGGSYAAQQPASIFPTPLKMAFGYAVPVAFTGYLPAISLLGLPGPAGLPAWLAWCLPAAVAWVWGVAMVLWRWGTRHYQGGGG